MSENSSSVNEESKNVIRGVTPPEPKLLGTYINMVPISDSEISSSLEEQHKAGAGVTPKDPQTEIVGSEATSTQIPTSQFPMSAMNMEQLQQFMMRMQMSCPNGQSAASSVSPGIGLGLGLGGGATLNMNTMIPTSTTPVPVSATANATVSSTTTTPVSSSYNIPPVGALDPNILASLGMNVQKPTLQPIQFPNMQTGVPNLCGIQGQDLNLAAWVQKQKIALALSGLQSNPQAATAGSNNSAGSENCLRPGVSAALSQSLTQAGGSVGGGLSGPLNSFAGIPGASLPAMGTPNVQSQLTPQLAAFLGNPNLVPSKSSASVGGPHAGAVQAPGATLGALGGVPGLGADSTGNVASPESVIPNMISPATDMSKIEAIIKQQQQQFIGSQLNAAAQLLRQHGIQATIGTEPLSGGGSEMSSKSKKPALLQRIVASKVNPKIFIVPNALNQEECDEIISLIQGRLESSKISITKKEDGKSGTEMANADESVDSDLQKSQDEDSEFCRSSTACIQPEETPLIREIEQRLGLLVDSSNLHIEPILVHKYSAEDYIKEHHDGDHRTHTISVFLSDVKHGGELDFPYAGIKIKPKKGLAVVWPNINSHGKLDYTTVHAVNKITKTPEKDCAEDNPPEDQAEKFPSPSSYLLYLHINKEPVRLNFEASKAMQQVVTHQNTLTVPNTPKIVTQVTYPTSDAKTTKE